MTTQTILGRERCGPTFIILLTLSLAAGCDADDDGGGGTEGATAGTGSDSGDDGSGDSDSGDDGSGDGDFGESDSGDDGDSDDGDSDDGDSGDSDSGDSGDGDTGDSGDSTGGEGIEIAGMWLETYPPDGEIVHTISDTAWTFDDAMFGATTYTLQSYDNTARVAIGDDGGSFSKLEWTWTDGDTQLWYCTAVFGAASAEQAAAGPDADPADPANGGCSGFSWSALGPAM